MLGIDLSASFSSCKVPKEYITNYTIAAQRSILSYLLLALARVVCVSNKWANAESALCICSWRSYAMTGQSALQRRYTGYKNSGWAASLSTRSWRLSAIRPISSWWSWATAGARRPCPSAAWWRRQTPWQPPSRATAAPSDSSSSSNNQIGRASCRERVYVLV